MRLYSSSAEWRRKLDLLQFDLQCCGSLSYVDWFLFDWQNSDYGPRDETETQDRISDEEYRTRAVPFSCCNLKAMLPCVHYQMTDSDLSSINTKGCATPLGNTVFRKVFVGSAMTALLIMTQVLLTFLLAKIASWPEGPFPREAVECTTRHLPNPQVPGRYSASGHRRTSETGLLPVGRTSQYRSRAVREVDERGKVIEMRAAVNPRGVERKHVEREDEISASRH
ncbi:peripherin-2-like [Cephus cinctus]|uniref:Peripherin-2-like n=1 Tax=Cephus cinctus TaxID=211228 RepID=A0AAJ7R8N2_CEPCN|nr:peripherin-2-like [Cephus cinctus]